MGVGGWVAAVRWVGPRPVAPIRAPSASAPGAPPSTRAPAGGASRCVCWVHCRPLFVVVVVPYAPVRWRARAASIKCARAAMRTHVRRGFPHAIASRARADCQARTHAARARIAARAAAAACAPARPHRPPPARSDGRRGAPSPPLVRAAIAARARTAYPLASTPIAARAGSALRRPGGRRRRQSLDSDDRQGGRSRGLGAAPAGRAGRPLSWGCASRTARVKAAVRG